LTLIAGEPGLGKSLLSCDLAARLSRSVLGPPAKSLLLSGEDSPTFTIRPRLDAANADTDHVLVLAGAEVGAECSIVLPDSAEELQAIITDAQPRLVVIDPITAYLASGTNSWKDQSIREALKPLQKIAERTKTAIVLVSHLNKSQDASPLNRVGGSVGLTAAARSVLVLTRDPDDPDGTEGSQRLLAQLKSNVGILAPTIRYEIESAELDADGQPIETARLRDAGFSSYEASDLLQISPEKRTARMNEAVEFLRDFLAANPQPSQSVIVAGARAGHAERTLKRAKQALGVSSEKLGGFNGGWYWVLPPDEIKQS
jgi:hypothetical protein